VLLRVCLPFFIDAAPRSAALVFRRDDLAGHARTAGYGHGNSERPLAFLSCRGRQLSFLIRRPQRRVSGVAEPFSDATHSVCARRPTRTSCVRGKGWGTPERFSVSVSDSDPSERKAIRYSQQYSRLTARVCLPPSFVRRMRRVSIRCSWPLFCVAPDLLSSVRPFYPSTNATCYAVQD